MELPLYETFTGEQLKTHGPPKKAWEFTTRRRVYETPFVYENVEVGDFFEIDIVKGIELKADTGYITVTEDRPIAEVVVVGSGCAQNGYNIVEWWEDGESLEHMNNQLVKRQRVDGLNGIHPSVWIELMRKAAWAERHTYESVTDGEIKDFPDIARRLTQGYCENLEMTFWENTVPFRVGTKDSYPERITVRAGCKNYEDPGTSIERYPADYAVRLIETHVIG